MRPAPQQLESLHLPLTRRTLIIGAGIAGMQAALHIADAGYSVILVERASRLGGRMTELSETYLNFSAAPDILRRKIERVESHKNIQVLTNAEVSEVSGYVGNFKAKIKSGELGENPPASGMEFSFDMGAIVVATGYKGYDLNLLPEYGGGAIPDVVDGLAFEKMLADGVEIRRPSDGKVPREVVFVQCAGSRDKEHGIPYCSKVCCMYVAKQAMLYQERIPTG